MFVLIEEDEVEFYEESADDKKDSMKTECKIHVHALSRSSNANVLKIIGKVGTHKISILVDSGCTHSFINVDVTLKCNVGLIIRMIGHTVT